MQNNQHDRKNISIQHHPPGHERIDKNPGGQGKRFSRLQLGLFAAVFAMVGAIVIFRSFASTPSTSYVSAATADYDTSEYYGVALPSAMFPDARGAEGDVAMSKVRTDIDTTGADWIRTDAGATLDRALYANSAGGDCGQSLCDRNKLTSKKILAIIDHNTVNQISALPCEIDGSRPPLEDLATWERIVDCVSKRYRGKVSAYEIWNEPTLPQFHLGYQNGSPENYYNMLKSAYTIIKQNDPAAKVIGLGGVEMFAGGQDGATRLQQSKDFAQGVYSLGGANYADAIAVHGYSWDSCDASIWDTYAQNIRYYHDMWSKDVWITETGQRSGLACTQSQYIDKAYATFINNDVKKVFWFALYDAPDGAFGVTGKEAAAHLAQFVTTPKQGQLRVETSPAAAASLSVHPGFVQTGDFNQAMDAGDYTVSFHYPYTTFNGRAVKLPNETNIEIRDGHTATVEVNILTGTVNVTTADNPGGTAGKGRLLMKTNSASQLSVGVHPGFVRQWGVNWEKISAGDYTVKLSWPNGTTTLNKVDGTSSSGTSKLPAETNVGIRGGGTTTIKVDTNNGTSTTSFVPDASIGADSGLIRVETFPAVKANLSVHPGFVDKWGVNWKPLAKGAYTVVTSYLPTQIQGVPIKLPAETNFEILAQKITEVKFDLVTGLSTKVYTWQ